MNYTLQLHSSHRTYPVPRGLHDLMSDIAREVLRRSPGDIEAFIAIYLEALVLTREASKGLTEEVDDVIADGARHLDIYETYGYTLSEASYFATKIQAFFRGWKTRMAIRKYLDDAKPKKNKYLTPITNVLTLRNSAIAATKIQAVFRGYYQRKYNKPIPSVFEDAWRPNWLWTDFQTSEADIKRIQDLEAQKREIKEDLRVVVVPKMGIDDIQVSVTDKLKGKIGDLDEPSEKKAYEIISHPDEELLTEELEGYEEFEGLEESTEFIEKEVEEVGAVLEEPDLESPMERNDVEAELEGEADVLEEEKGAEDAAVEIEPEQVEEHQVDHVDQEAEQEEVGIPEEVGIHEEQTLAGEGEEDG